MAAVATDEPQVAASTAHEPILACMLPPGSQASHCDMALYIFSAMPARSRISPSMTNIGTATRIASMLLSQVVSPMAMSSRPPA